MLVKNENNLIESVTSKLSKIDSEILRFQLLSIYSQIADVFLSCCGSDIRSQDDMDLIDKLSLENEKLKLQLQLKEYD